MTANMLDIQNEPAGTAYSFLLNWLGRTGSLAGLVVRGERPDHAEITSLFESLSPYIVDEVRVSEWPGTRLLGHTARLVRFRIVEGSVAVLHGRTDRLYGWLPPFPEDLCVWRDDGSLLLASIAHERDAWLEITSSEARVLGEFLELAASSG